MFTTQVQTSNPRTRQISSLRYAVGRFRLRVIGGPDAGAVVESDEPELSIGTAEGNELRLTDVTASRHHCSLISTPAGVRLRDLGSTNGTVLGGCRVETALLAPGTHLKVGGTEIRLELAEGEIAESISPRTRFGRLLGSSQAMRRLFAALPRLSNSDATLLIEGETGTGKSALASAVHDHSPRAGGPFVVIDCGAIPPTLIESELFGHERGAFTGAVAPREGLFSAANRGTLFLDEVGELPQQLQPKLLRALEERVVRRVGGERDHAVDVRVIAASNRDLREEVNRGRFRSDLFYRLNTVRVTVPPLRKRPEDVRLLAEHFWREISGDASALPPVEMVERFCRLPWPGNVRELRAAVERAILVGDADLGGGATPPVPSAAEALDTVDDLRSFREAKAAAVAVWECEYLGALIKSHSGNISRAARAARMNRNHLRELLLRHRLDFR